MWWAMAEIKNTVDSIRLREDLRVLKDLRTEETYRRTAPSTFRKVAGGLRRMVVFDVALLEPSRAAHAVVGRWRARTPSMSGGVQPGGLRILPSSRRGPPALAMLVRCTSSQSSSKGNP